MNYDVTVDQQFLNNAVKNAVETQAREVMLGLISDGVEFEAARNCVLVWANKTRGIVFARGGDVWHVQYANGLSLSNEDGSYRVFRSFHELLQWLFEQPEVKSIG